MATDAEASGDGADENDEVAPEPGAAASRTRKALRAPSRETTRPEEFPHFIEIWNDYDPSQRFTAIFPVGEKEGAVGSSVAYYIIEPGSHTGLHSDNVEEIAFVAEGEGEVFSIGVTRAARGREVPRVPGELRPRHLRARQRRAPAALVLPDEPRS